MQTVVARLQTVTAGRLTYIIKSLSYFARYITKRTGGPAATGLLALLFLCVLSHPAFAADPHLDSLDTNGLLFNVMGLQMIQIIVSVARPS